MTYSRNSRRWALAGVALLFVAGSGLPAKAQQSPYVVGSTVSGHVFCADTNAPARFAKVLLESTGGGNIGEEFMRRLTDNVQKVAGKDGEASPPTPDEPLPEDAKKAVAATKKGLLSLAFDMMTATTVGLDGAYSFSGVKPGTYYVRAIYAGYVDAYSEFSDEDFASTDTGVRARIARMPIVTVTGTDSVHAEVRLERGAAIGGRVLYEDGSPAVGWILSVIKPGDAASVTDVSTAQIAQALSIMGASQTTKTDDLGRYRISGLSAGKYVVMAALIAPSVGINARNIGDGGSGITLMVYSGDTFSRADAKRIKVSAGEEIAGTDIKIPDHSLHNITGHVYAQSDAHTLNVGNVLLTSKSDPALHFTASIRDDGSFHFEYLPGGATYTLRVGNAADGNNRENPTGPLGIMNVPNPEITRKYGTATTEVVLADTDVDSVRLEVAETDWKPPMGKSYTPENSSDEMPDGVSGGTTGSPNDKKQ